ncbi:hypothetical protein FA15DRAFT_201958 [Coprinopsis marcescibilis]|uniref:DUF3835 domain-containing protein n=1 Tax=Coprinopsis marcescibilis TaxID=230819 RepID=A0A5C3LCL8_COPMA|nr:hypothetical protein FA15DRAFT_201958 [Coprinopsis marcescibilis]
MVSQGASGSEQQAAFRNLIESVTRIDSGGSGPKSNLSAEAVQRLAERLSEIVGYDAVKDFTPQKNERGELVNEEGLPIVDITEPVGDDEPDGPIWEDRDPIVPWNQLPPDVRERLTEERNRQADQLEAEEREEEERERARVLETYEEGVRRRSLAAANEKERIQAAKEMQRKMGKALLQNLAETKEREQRERENQRLEDEAKDFKRKDLASKKKNVSFADDLEVQQNKQKEMWGDVVPARLKSLNRPTLLSERQMEKQPMKFSVVERHPVASKPLPTPPLSTFEPDSDDETDVEEDNDADVEVDTLARHSSGSEESESDEGHEELEEELDLDYASLQRRIQVEYLHKRNTMGQAAAEAIDAMAKHDDAPETESGVGLAFGDPSKPSISQFRASKLASAYNADNSGASNFVVPSATAKSVQKSIRTGKLDDKGNLIGGEDDSASELEDENMQEVLELLKKGEVYNVGQHLHTVPPANTTSAAPSETASALRLDDATKSLPPLATKNTVSKFKLSRSAGRSDLVIDGLSPSPTPVNNFPRSSPKLESRSLSPVEPVQGLPPTVPTTLQSQFSTIVDSPSFAPPAGSSNPSFNMIADPPSFTPTPIASNSGGKHPAFSMIVDSPSFPPPGKASSTRRPERPPTVLSTAVREAKPIQKPAPAPVPAPAPWRPDRPPTVLTSIVSEAKPVQRAIHTSDETVTAQNSDSANQQAKKVSRFKQQRS